MRSLIGSIMLAGSIGLLTSSLGLAEEKPAKATRVTRIFLQDHDARTLRWADVLQAQEGKFSVEAWNEIEGFPKLDAQTQTLVQMREAAGRIVMGVRDNDQGKKASGWVLLSTGSRFREHGDHGHWDYASKPFVLESRIDQDQGNPAHVYEYDGSFYLANDSKNGFTQIHPEDWFRSVSGTITRGTPRFFSGGGNHITLAAVGNKMAFSTWIDGGGPNKGRVDLVPLDSAQAKGDSLHLPTGVIHGATACAGKVFFAPADGICWIEAEQAMTKPLKAIAVSTISFGLENKKPLRTGAFAQIKDHLLCVTGQEQSSRLVILDAASKTPEPMFLPLQGKEYHKPLTPAVVMVGEKRPYALIFHDHDKKHQAEDLLELFELDPNLDGKFGDARHVKTIKVGPSSVEGHYGHHGVSFDAEGLFAFFTNPGEGTISILDLKKLEITATIKTGGNPTAILAHGGNETED
jgi:hypothetical protein